MANEINAGMQAFRLEKADLETSRLEEIAQEAVEDNMQAYADRGLFKAVTRTFVPLSERTTSKKTESKESEKVEEIEAVQEVLSIEASAEEFQRKNPELQPKALLALRSRISSKDSPLEIVKKLLESYPDHYLADDALDFLIETSNPELARTLKEVKKQFNIDYRKEILAGRNIAEQATEFAKQGLGTTQSLRNLYREVIQNPKDPATRFSEFTETFTFEKMKTVIAFIFHSLGSDLKAKGSSIEKGELAALMTETKVMQAILSVYRFFKSRMNLIYSSYEREGYNLPPKVTFESLSKLFVKLLLERYPSAEKVYQIGVQLGIQDEWIAEAILFTQMRDGVRHVDPRLFKSEQHRQDILTIFIDVLKEIDDKLEEEAEEDDEDDEVENEQV